MAHSESSPPSNFLIWIYLLVLALASVGASIVFPSGIAEGAIIALSAAKILLVALYFMHLRIERLFIHLLALVPLFFVIVLFLGLAPDIIYGK
ncbi:MAG: cytochrome C oxidase subunit IV family protein [bacterium]|nr:cytochrome C oxidase subunit IV family protein [bacterium]